jgi:Tol biopolymer transport system component
MVRASALFSAILILYLSSPSAAQDLVPVIHLSTAETERAQRLSQELDNAQERVSKADSARRAFYETFKTAHPKLTGLEFTSDFRMAFSPAPWNSAKRAALIDFAELTPQEQQKLGALYEEVNLSRKNLDQSWNDWWTFQHDLVISHIEKPGPVSPVYLPTGIQLMFPAGWRNGLAFTPDYRVAVPRQE